MNAHFPTNNTAIKLYRFALSGHCHRVELFLSLLDLPYELVDLDLPNGEHKQASFLQINPFAQVPAIDDNGTLLTDSNAILVYLAKRYGGDQSWLPEGPVAAANVQRWLSVAAGELAAGPAAARLVTVFGAALDHELVKKKAHSVLRLIDEVLSDRGFLASEEISLADMACYTYIKHAPEGGVLLDTYPHILAWLQSIEALPGYIAMLATDTPA
ncbi:glutathione S-transferase family protein [Agaribacterium sp. ZY112]|uniref:glutathione S-transferase family protein n=1 Tax=Agaribacterium sp. ZY112 TaxID=3233574 RepID=UPI0035235EB4